MRSFTTGLVWFVWAMCGGPAGWADKPESQADRWASTELTFELSKKFISNSSCVSSIKYLESCVAAIDAANKLIQKPVSLIGNALDFEKTLREISKVLPQDVPVQLMLGDAINAHLRTFDAHAYVMPAETFKSNDGYTGLGITVRKVARGFFVTEVLENTAAEKAKLTFGDLITHVDGIEDKEFRGFSITNLAKALRGPVGAPVSLRIDRNGASRDVKVVRARVESKTVSSSIFSGDPSLGYIRIRDFVAGQTCGAVKKALVSFGFPRVKKLMLDLRGNPGGSTHEAICIAGLFAGMENIVGLQAVETQIPMHEWLSNYATSENIRWLRGWSIDINTMPLAILVDSGTASAAEIVAGSLQSLQRAWLVGERTFGKGTQQTITNHPLFPTLTLGMTTERVFMPNGKSHQQLGLNPSFAVNVMRGANDLESLENNSEAIQYPSSLPAVNLPWFDPRDEAIMEIKACIDRDDLDQKFLKPMGDDYQRAYAAAVLKCEAI